MPEFATQAPKTSSDQPLRSSSLWFCEQECLAQAWVRPLPLAGHGLDPPEPPASRRNPQRDHAVRAFDSEKFLPIEFFHPLFIFPRPSASSLIFLDSLTNFHFPIFTTTTRSSTLTNTKRCFFHRILFSHKPPSDATRYAPHPTLVAQSKRPLYYVDTCYVDPTPLIHPDAPWSRQFAGGMRPPYGRVHCSLWIPWTDCTVAAWLWWKGHASNEVEVGMVQMPFCLWTAAANATP